MTQPITRDRRQGGVLECSDVQGRRLGLGPNPLGQTDEIGVIGRRRMTEIVAKLALIGRNLMKTEQQGQAIQTRILLHGSLRPQLPQRHSKPPLNSRERCMAASGQTKAN